MEFDIKRWEKRCYWQLTICNLLYILLYSFISDKDILFVLYFVFLILLMSYNCCSARGRIYEMIKANKPEIEMPDIFFKYSTWAGNIWSIPNKDDFTKRVSHDLKVIGIIYIGSIPISYLITSIIINILLT